MFFFSFSFPWFHRALVYFNGGCRGCRGCHGCLKCLSFYFILPFLVFFRLGDSGKRHRFGEKRQLLNKLLGTRPATKLRHSHSSSTQPDNLPTSVCFEPNQESTHVQTEYACCARVLGNGMQ